MSETKSIPRCQSCGVAFDKHLGIVGTCRRLQITMDALRGIALTKADTKARRIARVTLRVLDKGK